MTAETSNARGEWVLERLRGVLEHGKMGDKCLIAPDLVTAAIASLSAPPPAAARGDVPYDRELIAQMLDAAEAPAFTMEEMDTQARLLREAAQAKPEARVYQCPRCATSMEVDPTAKPEARGGEEVAAWETEDGRVISARQKTTALRDGGASASSVAPYTTPLYRTAPPSAPVGVEAIAAEIRASLGRGATDSTRRRWAIELEALAQQPAAAGEEIMVNAAHDVFTLPLQPSGLSSGPRFVVHVPGPEQPAAVDGMAELVGLLDEVRSHFTRDDDLPDDLLPRIDAALAAQHQEPKS